MNDLAELLKQGWKIAGTAAHENLVVTIIVQKEHRLKWFSMSRPLGAGKGGELKFVCDITP